MYPRYISRYRNYEPITFTPDTWQVAVANNRGFMLDDMLAKHQLVGMDHASIIALLGPPDREFDDPTLPGHKYMTYDLGWRHVNPDALFKTESVTWLRLTVDDSTKVTEVSILRDAI